MTKVALFDEGWVYDPPNFKKKLSNLRLLAVTPVCQISTPSVQRVAHAGAKTQNRPLSN